MCHMRERFWTPKLRSLVKKVVYNCDVCRRYRVKPSTSCTFGSKLPAFRAELFDAFSVTGVDFAGPVYHKIDKSSTAKAYIALFTCAGTRAVHLKLCRDLTAQEFKRALKEFVARRDCPQTIISDNGKTFVATGKWLSVLKKDHSLFNYMGKLNIKWKFNLARAPWWGGFFERLIGIMKRTLSKVIGRSLLRFDELEEVLIDVETSMNNRPLIYQGEEFERPVITPNILLRGNPVPVVEEYLELLGDESEVTKRMKLLQRSKSKLRQRFMNEYVHALEERQQLSSDKQGVAIPEDGVVVLLKGETKQRAQWKLGRVQGKVTGKDGVVRGLKLKLGSGYVVERPLQLVCDLEIGGENRTPIQKWTPNPEAAEFVPRRGPARRAKDAAQRWIEVVLADDREDI